MSGVLLDANVLIALVVVDHVHHEAAERWIAELEGSFSSCPVTQGSLMRLLVREGVAAHTAREVVAGLGADPRHEFWPDDVSYSAVDVRGVVGHRQVTDAYLAQLARRRQGELATFDGGLVAAHPDVARMVPTS